MPVANAPFTRDHPSPRYRELVCEYHRHVGDGYRITDSFADPPGMTEHLHTEQLIRLPDIYMVFRPPDDSPAVNDLPAAQSGRVTCGSFNALSKITPQVVHAWSRILLSVPGARLVMATVPAGRARERMAAMFIANGVDPSRVEFWSRLPLHEFLALHRRCRYRA